MAKLSVVLRDNKRRQLVARHKQKRAELKAVINDPGSSYEDKQKAVALLSSMPRDSSPVRLRNRCIVTGRPRGFCRRFGLSRHKLRELSMNGAIPGIHKASW
jgi:small subunit ribosomal protein S14